jgi:DNA (cytosine-5)-methyltransferase 1
VLKAISLFTGAGGMDVGFIENGFDVILANEIEADAVQTYMANHPSVRVIHNDINDCFDEFAKLENQIDLVFGGPPCQGFSIAGKMNPDDERSKLVWSFLKVIEIVKPRVFVMENVKALAVLVKWDDIKRGFIVAARKLGYDCKYIVLNAADYGIPQKRERAFFIGLKDGEIESKAIKVYFDSKKERQVTVREALAPFVEGELDNPHTCTAKITYATMPVMRKSPYAGMIFNGMGRPINIDGLANTLPASMGGNKTPIIDEEYLRDSSTTNWIKEYHYGLWSKKQCRNAVKRPKGCGGLQ